MMRTNKRKKSKSSSQIRPTKVINNKEDWLSYDYVFDEAIKKTFSPNGITYYYYADSIRFRTDTNNNLNMMRTHKRKKSKSSSQIRPTKVINNKEDWLSYDYVFDEAIKKTFSPNGMTYYYYADSISSLFNYMKLQLTGNTEIWCNLVHNTSKQEEGTLCSDNVPTYWSKVHTISIYYAVREVLMHNHKIFKKLQITIGMYIDEKGLGTTVYTTIMMMIREQLRINDHLDFSIDVSSLNHPVSNLFGNSLDDFHSRFFLAGPKSITLHRKL